MFLNRRALQAEYFDLPDRPAQELADGYRMLAQMNRLFLLGEPFTRRLPGWLGKERCASVSILDLGAGDGTLGDELTNWAARRGWDWRITNLDLNAQALRLNPGGAFRGAAPPWRCPLATGRLMSSSAPKWRTT